MESPVVLTFTLIGAGIKYIDDAFDERIYDRRLAMMLTLILSIIWMVVSVNDPISATILFSVFFAVLFAGKIDNPAFKLSASSLAFVFVISGNFDILLPPLFFLMIIGILDEMGNDYADLNNTGRLLEILLIHRPLMKLGVFVLSLFSVFSWSYLLAFLAFDFAYGAVGYYRNHVCGMDLPPRIHRYRHDRNTNKNNGLLY